MTLFFFLFSCITVLSSIAVISSRNPVHSVFFLILAFVNSAGIFVLAGAEFLAMILLIVYVGAVAVLFLFVVMMLNVAQQENEWFQSKKGKEQSSSHIPFGFLISTIIFFELIIVIGGWKFRPEIYSVNNLDLDLGITNTHSIGSVLYTDFILLFQISGMILLVSMIGAIVLTYKKRKGLKRQSYINQISREKTTGVELLEVEKNKGVKIDV